MEREANYTAVGAFVLLVLGMAGLFVYWYSDTSGHHDYNRYEVYFDGSVAGLTQGAAVRYLGVNVGRVADMGIDKRNSGRVQVIVDVDSGTPVSAGTVAELSQQGVTGVLYIDLSDDAAHRALLDTVPSEKYPVIRSSRSNLDQLLASLPQMVGRADEVLNRISGMLDERTLRTFSDALTNIDASTAQLPATLKGVQSLMTDLRGTVLEVRGTVAGVHGLVDSVGPQLNTAAAQVADITRNLAQVTNNASQVLDENRAGVHAFTRDGLPQLQQLMGDGNAAFTEVRDLAHSLREDPSQLLLEKSEQGVLIPP